MIKRYSSRSGFTIIELAISAVIMSVVGYALMMCTAAANNTQRTVCDITSGDRAMRKASGTFQDELRTSSDSRVTVTTLSDQNSRVDLQVPVESGGDLLWGVYDKTLGATYADQNKVDWKLRYTVQSTVSASGETTRTLVRQILDTASVVRSEETVATRLNRGDDPDPGFRVVKAGDMWTVTVSTKGSSNHSSGSKAEFHVRTRN